MRRCYGITRGNVRCRNRTKKNFLCPTHQYQAAPLTHELVSDSGGCFLGRTINDMIVPSCALIQLPKNWIAIRKDDHDYSN